MKCLPAVILLITLSFAHLYPAELEITLIPEVYTSIDREYSPEPFRIQYGGGITTGVLIPIISPVSFTAQVGIHSLQASQPYGLSVQRGFTSYTAGLGLHASISDFGGIQLLSKAWYSTYLGTYREFTHISFSVSPYLHLFSSFADFSLIVQYQYDLRRDIDHNQSAGIGIKASFPLGRRTER